jgi:N-6 DNA Methylase
VSTQLAEQVLAALYELLRGFQAADYHRHGELLREILAKNPDHVYTGLLTVLMRLVFILYAEDRGLLSNDPVYVNYYSVSGLFERLRADAGHYPDTMDQRYGAWAQLLTLFRLIYEGGSHGNFQIPARKGYLFDPHRYPFLEGQPRKSPHTNDDGMNVPHVSDGVVFHVLSNLLILDGERLSYRSLDVEQIGSVYEAVMGFNLEVAGGPSIAIKPAKAHGAPTTINLEALLSAEGADRVKWLRDHTDQQLTGRAAEALKNAATIEDVLEALEPKIARNVTPNVVPNGAMILQPSNERRRSGSHYTPRSLTQPIVRTTLRPIFERLGPKPAPQQILDLKVCDPAMGSGAFLVEACRQIGDELVKAWHLHDSLPTIPPDEDEVLHAHRLVAQRCLYGLDKNAMAVDLAKLSLWLATLAKDHPFTFLDHSLRCGDSLVGLTHEQLVRFHWQPGVQRALDETRIRAQVERATAYRKEILDSAESISYPLLQEKLASADQALDVIRFIGHVAIAAFFSADRDRQRRERRDDLFANLSAWFDTGMQLDHQKLLAKPVKELRSSKRPVEPFHWEIEFPEVFDRENGGFDAIIGNPPFAGKNTLINSHRESYLDWLKTIHEDSHGNSDLVAHFYRRAFNLLRKNGYFGLIATNTIGQGDTRSTGLHWICTHGGTIYAARKRLKWPGEAAVVVSVLHVCKGQMPAPYELDGRSVPIITAYVFHAGGHDDPAKMSQNVGKSFQGPIPLGMGFTFDDTDTSGVASPISEMYRLLAKDPRNAERIFPYIGGEEINNSPTHAHHRYVITFGEMDEQEARNWPDLMTIVEEKVKPERMENKREVRRRHWWRFGEVAPALFSATRGMERVLVHAYVSQYLAFTYVSANYIVAGPQNIFAFDNYPPFCVLQSRPHDVWAHFFAATLEDRLSYTRSDCFETFPFPEGFENNHALEQLGKEYYEFRAALMVRNNEGLTKTYNRFHEPDERSLDILRLRELHNIMDRAVLDAYGWMDLKPACEFILDYEEQDDEENGTGSFSRTRRKPWRYRWPDDFRDEVLARLLELNKQRAEQEHLAGLSAEAASINSRKQARPGAKSGRTKKRQSDQTAESAHPNLPGMTT